MTVFNLGSINIDHFYQVPHIPAPGETLAATAYSSGLGGKGLNQSVALARGGADVVHIGAVGPDGAPVLDQIKALGVDVSHITQVDAPTGHAIINVATDGENCITLFQGANVEIPTDHIAAALGKMGRDDWLMLQNETNGHGPAIEYAVGVGARIVYSAAPFDIAAVKAILPFIDTLVVNEIEANQLLGALGVSNITELDVPHIVMTLGVNGAQHIATKTGLIHRVDGLDVQVVDTTGAGDTFIGYFVALLSNGADIQQALEMANRAAALKVSRSGTAAAVPELQEV